MTQALAYREIFNTAMLNFVGDKEQQSIGPGSQTMGKCMDDSVYFNSAWY
jgi:hypothetical protein